jgi:hypothetical protein
LTSGDQHHHRRWPLRLITSSQVRQSRPHVLVNGHDPPLHPHRRCARWGWSQAVSYAI